MQSAVPPPSQAPADPLRRGAIYSLLMAFLVVCAPHAPRLPIWVPIAVTGVVAWRVWLLHSERRLPSKWVLFVLAMLGTTGVLMSFGPMLGRDASVALLACMTSLKAMELRTQRDAMVLLCLGYFLIITNFLYSQTIPAALFMLGVMAWLTATLVSLQDHNRRLGWRGAARTSGVLLLQAAPVMLVLFVLFPRVQGPIFGIPQTTSAGITGLSDRMSPGDLSNLGLSDEVAFRVQFHSPAPKASELYWRGPVLWDFDGRTWSAGEVPYSILPRHETRGEALHYTVTLEPHSMRWLFAIDLPVRLPSSATLSADYQLLALRPLRNRIRYDTSSSLGYRYGLAEPEAMLQRALRLPRGSNPRALELAGSLRARSATDAQLVDNALNLFRTQLFFYTLVPPPLGRHSVDEFLFETRRGFCEHYASAFVFLMRAAGLPARVVTGYQGGEMNPLGDYLIVRQSEAHAWAEVWLQGQGWVRIDPTAAVSPARVEVGIAAALPRTDPLPSSVRGDVEWLRQARLTWDATANAWNQWVLGYTPDRQVRLLESAGVKTPSWRTIALLLLAATSLVAAVLAALVLVRLRAAPRDPVQLSWLRFCRKLARLGCVRRPGEGPIDFASRAAAALPAAAEQIRSIARLYVELRYAGSGSSPRALRAQVQAFRAWV
jgi:transglutaminase-like putative cysteine protease